jgi:retron-type reverse transcriptase
MNLFMHYALDTWMQRHFPQCPFARYTDDAVVHCRSETQEVMHAIASGWRCILKSRGSCIAGTEAALKPTRM